MERPICIKTCAIVDNKLQLKKKLKPKYLNHIKDGGSGYKNIKDYNSSIYYPISMKFEIQMPNGMQRLLD